MNVNQRQSPKCERKVDDSDLCKQNLRQKAKTHLAEIVFLEKDVSLP